MSRLRLITTVGLLVGVCIGASSGLAALAPLPAPQSLLSDVTNGPGPLERQAVLPTLDEPLPRRTVAVTPIPPDGALPAGTTASFRVHAVLDGSGRIAEARVVAPRHVPAAIDNPQALEAAVLAAVRQWQFEAPALAPMLIVTDVTLGDAALTTPPDPDAPMRVGGAVAAPRRVHNVPPVYPQVALDAKVQGVVIVEAIIERTGDVSAARVLRSIPLLDGAALEAVRQWKYEPQPHRLTMTMTINFTLAADEEAPR